MKHEMSCVFCIGNDETEKELEQLACKQSHEYEDLYARYCEQQKTRENEISDLLGSTITIEAKDEHEAVEKVTLDILKRFKKRGKLVRFEWWYNSNNVKSLCFYEDDGWFYQLIDLQEI